MTDYIVIGILLVVVGLAARYVYRAKKSGQKCIGCPGGCSCGGQHGSTACGCQSHAHEE